MAGCVVFVPGVALWLHISWQAQHSANLEVQVAASAALSDRRSADFVAGALILEVHISLQTQHFVNLEVQILYVFLCAVLCVKSVFSHMCALVCVCVCAYALECGSSLTVPTVFGSRLSHRPCKGCSCFLTQCVRFGNPRSVLKSMGLQTLILIDIYSNPVLIRVSRHSENQVFRAFTRPVLFRS